MKILIIEDEYDALNSIETFLKSENFIIEKAMDFHSGIEKIQLYEYDCILLDINLPGGNGLKILEKIKNENIEANVIIISARDSIDDKITGLDIGADDYITKPFHLAELLARIKAVIRRKQQDGKNILKLKNVEFDFFQRTIKIDGNNLKLNRKEFDILSFFAVNTNRLITKEALAEHVWGDNIDLVDNFDFIYSQVKNLRKKLKDNNADINIENVYGIGYKMTS